MKIFKTNYIYLLVIIFSFLLGRFTNIAPLCNNINKACTFLLEEKVETKLNLNKF